MEIKLLFFGIALSLTSLTAQTLNLYNTANGALDDAQFGADFVAGDTFSLQIEGAAANSAVTMMEWQNGTLITQTPYYWGQTDGSGNFTLSGTETAAFLGSFQEEWFVGGVQLGNTLEFEVIPVPDSLSVELASVASLRSSCVGTFGIYIDVAYNILDRYGINITTSVVPMIPYEDGQFFYPNDVPDGTFSSNVGPVSGYSDSNEYADGSTGTFHDVPVGACSTGTFSNAGATQALSMYIGDNKYVVRQSQRWIVNGTGQGHGGITNDDDVSVNR